MPRAKPGAGIKHQFENQDPNFSLERDKIEQKNNRGTATTLSGSQITNVNCGTLAKASEPLFW